MAGEPTTVPFDAEQIAFVTRRYEALHGMTNAGAGAALLFGAVALPFLHESTAEPLSSSMAIALMCNVPAMAALEFECRYRATFGRTEAPFAFATLASWTGIFVLIGAFMDALIMDRAPMRWPSAAGIGLALSSGMVLLMDWRWRPHFAVAFCAGIAATAMTAGVEPAKYFPSWESDPVRTPVLMLANAVVGLGLVTSGMLDHRLLTATLTPFHGARGTTVEMRRRAAGGRTWLATLVTGSAFVTLCFPAHYMVLVLPLVLVFACAMQMIWKNLARWRRPGTPDPWQQAEPFGLHPDTTIIIVLLAAGAVIDAAFLWPAPIASTLVFAFSSLWIALRDWSSRKYYLLGAILPLALLPLAVRLEPARSFTLLLFAWAAALAVESYLDGRGGEPASSASGLEDADTI